ncbi:Ger(x)C family spore germination protein [Cohnella phaseoli]|uniref:Ger(X)C family germination protein n=1 Tax=Cohnella phaseoli TaxID=456490 RepID=A0A3D9JVQ9_9BACL|nr:Ger(x)C family spore germination protein [Cohnella phaseoli]RED77526.1 Ger(x)C family germination protein [Cohnella phaseoli]
MRNWLLCASVIGICCLLTGCWDVKSLQDVNYFTGIGIDYENKRYEVYVQQLDFSSVAKTEAGKGDRPALVWVGRASGETLSEAIIELYQTTQQTVFWGHLNSIVLTNRVLKNGDLLGLIDSLIRYPEIRYTPWIYGTDKKIEELFTTKPFFNLSPMNSILYAPETNYSQRPIIAPMRVSRFLRQVREPGETTLLPSLSVTNHTWTQNREPDPKLEINGAFALRNTHYQEWLPAEKLLGVRWLVDRKQGARVKLSEGDERIATLRLSKPRTKVRIAMQDGEPVFHVDFEAVASLLELWKIKSEKELETIAGKQIEEQIRTTHRIGWEANADVLDLEHRLYRRDYPTWKRLTSGGRSPLAPTRLGEVKATVKIATSGMYKMKRRMTPY